MLEQSSQEGALNFPREPFTKIPAAAFKGLPDWFHLPFVNYLLCFCPECRGPSERREKWTRYKMQILEDPDNRRQRDVLLMQDEMNLEPPE